MAGYNSFPQEQAPTFDNPGMQQSEPMGGGFQQPPAPEQNGLKPAGSFSNGFGPVQPQFSRPNGMLPQSGYNRFANRFAAAGGNVAAPPSWAPQNPLLAQRRPSAPRGPAMPAPAWKPEDGSIGLPPPNGF